MTGRGSGLLVGLEIDGDGAHPAAPRAAPGAPTAPSAQRLAALGRRAEEAGLDFVTLDPTVGTRGADPERFDPVVAAAHLSARTDALGLVPVVATAGAEPFHVSNQLSSLDHASAGRAGWWVATGGGGADAASEGADVVDAARWLWDSWQDDAVIADDASGRFLDADRVHHVDFVGRSFSIRGPALVPRPPQGQVPVFARAGELPAALVDVEVVAAASLEELSRVRVAATRALAEIEVVLDAGVPAAERLAGLDRHAPWAPASPGERPRWVGDAPGLAALLTALADRVDAVRLVPAVLDVDGPVVTDVVLPALGRLLRRPVAGETLRARFGLERPAGRYAS